MQQDSHHSCQNHHDHDHLHQIPSPPSIPFILKLLDFITGKSFIAEAHRRGKLLQLIVPLLITIKNGCWDSLVSNYIMLIENILFMGHFPQIIKRIFGGKNSNKSSL